MFPDKTISRTELARSTRQTLEQARRGQTVLVESYGEEQVAIVDAQDYRLLLAAAVYRANQSVPAGNKTALPQGLNDETVKAAREQDGPQAVWNLVIATYLDGNISLGRAAELLQLNRFNLQARFHRLGLPLRLGPETVAEAQAEVDTLHSSHIMSSQNIF